MSLKASENTAIFTCDSCGATHEIALTKGRPVNWAKLDFARDIEPQKQEKISLDLCQKCADRVVTAFVIRYERYSL
jgi:ribosomal protein L31